MNTLVNRIKASVLILCLLAISTVTVAQKGTNVQKLQELSTQFKLKWEEDSRQAQNFARRNGIPFRFESEEGKYFELQSVKDGIPMYYVTENSNSAATISTNKVLPGGSSGLDLDGSGITIHEWDGGAVLGTHQEYAGRVVMGDGATTTHYHSTHVAGTLIASGVNPSAKGMAPAANLRAFDWNNDEGEMASEGANGALFSNHSYGYATGWSVSNNQWVWYGNTSISTEEDYLFGFYDSQARDWDQIARNAPYYLIVKSAGNDRGDGPSNGSYPQDGPYDCISHAGNAKNILTVGAVNDIPTGYSGPSSVVMSSFSGWGPADDGRIKPDIVTNGVSLISSYNTDNNSYAPLSGTSMASPSAAGSLALLQQHYENLNGAGNYMLAATLKGLVISTADEAGSNPGPDYSYGWGLMNTEKAALKISEDQSINVIEELVLNNGGSYTRTVYSDGTKPIKVTVCWTDLAGTPVSASLDPSNAMLVNDLDLRISSGANTFYPWKLDRINHSAAATNNTENNVDNVEMVFIASPSAGEYTITIDHDGTLSGGSQAFSIILDGISEGTPAFPVADFAASSTTVFEGQAVNFSDLSTGIPTSWSWTFSGGTPSTSTAKNPTVVYSTAGTYDVSLYVSNSSGNDTETKLQYIKVEVLPPVANFSSDITKVLIGNSVNFSDESANNPTSWAWSFPGGSPSSSTDKNPTVTYNTIGNYQVSLTATNAGGSNTKTLANYIEVWDGILNYCDSRSSDFSNEYISSVAVGNLNNSSGGSTYSDFTGSTFNAEAGLSYSISLDPWKSNPSRKESWRVWIDYNIDGDFNDSGELVYSTDNKRNAVSGTFTIPPGTSGLTRMRVAMKYNSTSTDPCDLFTYGEVEDYSVQIGAVVPEPPVANFTASSTSVTAGQSVQFTDLSTNNPTSWSWIFDGGTPGSSTSGNPSITYNTPGTYTVSLTATNGVGSDGEIKVGYIEVTQANIDPPIAGFTASSTSIYEGGSIDFTDMSTNNPSSWSWTFAGGTPGSSSLENPSVTYNTAGTYTVELTSTNTYGSDTETKVDYITVNAAPVQNYCEPTGINNSSNFINLVNIGGVAGQIGKNASGYEFFPSPQFNLNAGGTYSVTLTPSVSTSRNFWRIWIDVNGNGDFIDSGETLFTANNKKGTVTGSITIPSSIVASTRIRIGMKTGSSMGPCDNDFEGELEDYIANIAGGNGKSGTISNEDISEKTFLVYPNPAENIVFVEFKGWDSEKIIRLIDMTGRTIMMKTTHDSNTVIDVSAYPKGIYFLDVNNGIFKENKKIIIQ